MSGEKRMEYTNTVAEQSYQSQDIRPESPTGSIDTPMSELNLNQYATKKTVAQGMLDLALLTANVSQLKFLLEAGDEHPYHTALLTLIIVSICLQTCQAIVCVILAMIFDLNKVEEHRAANIYNNVCLIIIIVVTVLNVVISGFDMKTDKAMFSMYRN